MTQEKLTCNDQNWLAYYQQIGTHPPYNNLAPDIQSPKKSIKKGYSNEDLRTWYWKQSGRQGFDTILNKLAKRDPIGRNFIEQYLRDQYRRNCRPNTMQNSLTTIGQFLFFIKSFGKRHLEEITRGDIGAFVEHEQDRDLKASTVHMRLRTLKAFLRYLIEEDVVRPEVLSKRMIIKVPDSLPRAIDPDDIKKLLPVIDNIRNRALLLILLRTGMRVGELLNTLVEDVNLKERKIEIFEAMKSRVGRVVYLYDDALVALKAWLKERESHKSYLFYVKGRHRITYPAVRAMFNKYIDKAGLSHKGYTLHCLRHTCASELLNAGMRLECVQQILGHSSIEMTRRYARLTDKTREEEYFRAMKIIERGEIDGHYQLDSRLQKVFEKKELLTSHSEELHEHP